MLTFWQYNLGVPGGVKNAIDYLYNELTGKAILIVTYGIQGGSTASFNLKRTFEGMKLRVVETRPRLFFPGGAYGADCQSAITTGVLGEESRKSWAESADLSKGLKELVEFVNDPEKKGTEVGFDAALYN